MTENDNITTGKSSVALREEARRLLAEAERIDDEYHEPSGWGPDLTNVWKEDRYSENGDVCSIPDCGRTHWDDGVPLTYFTVLVCPGEEGYSEVTQALCMDHGAFIANLLVDAGFGSHNHHGTCSLDAEDICGGYGKCQTPAEYGPELVCPERSSINLERWS